MPVANAVFPNKLKISLDSRSCKLEIFTRPKKNSPDSMWSTANSYLVRPKKKLPKNKTDQKNKQIVGPMWLGILSDLPRLVRSVRINWERLQMTSV